MGSSTLMQGAYDGDSVLEVMSAETGLVDSSRDNLAAAVQLLHRASAASAVPLIEFFVGRGYAPVDGYSSSKRLKTATRAQRSLRRVGKQGTRPPSPLHIAA